MNLHLLPYISLTAERLRLCQGLVWRGIRGKNNCHFLGERKCRLLMALSSRSDRASRWRKCAMCCPDPSDRIRLYLRVCDAHTKSYIDVYFCWALIRNTSYRWPRETRHLPTSVCPWTQPAVHACCTQHKLHLPRIHDHAAHSVHHSVFVFLDDFCMRVKWVSTGAMGSDVQRWTGRKDVNVGLNFTSGSQKLKFVSLCLFREGIIKIFLKGDQSCENCLR